MRHWDWGWGCVKEEKQLRKNFSQLQRFLKTLMRVVLFSAEQ
jgi:hypothetical protein